MFHSNAMPGSARLMIFLCLCLGLLSSCTFDKEEDLLVTPVTCDTSNVSFTADVFPLLNSYGCVGCHQGISASAGVRLDSHEEVVKWQVRMIGSIAHEPGFSRMPKGGGKMNDCEIDQIRAWVNLGSPDN